MAAREHREIHDVQQSKKMVPLITCETTFGQHVRKLVLGVNNFDLDLEVQIDLVKQRIQRDSAGSGHVSDRWTSSFNENFDHHFTVIKDVQRRFALRRACVCGYVI